MTDLLEQYHAVREELGFFDRPDTGKIAICGADRFSWLQGMVSNDVYQLRRQGSVGCCQACVLDATGHILTDATLINVDGATHNGLAQELGLPEDDFVLIDLPRVNVSKILELFDRYIITEDVAIRDVTSQLACISLQGPTADAMWGVGFAAGRNPLLDSHLFHNSICAPRDHTGSAGFDVYYSADLGDKVRNVLRELGVTEIGLEVEEILRVEAGIPKYGVDMNATTLAPEANLMPTHISLTKGCYVGQEVIARIHSRGHTNRALTGLTFRTGDVPAVGDRVHTPLDAELEGREVGWVTSVVTASPAMAGRPIALGYVRHETREPGVTLRVGETGRSAVATELPFYQKPGE